MKKRDQRSKIRNQQRNKNLYWYVKLYVLYSVICVLCSFSSAFAEDIKSRAAVVMEATTGRILYAKNPELRLMPASTTKLMTALVVVENANLKDIVTISRNAASVAPTRSGLKAGDKVTVQDLLYAALMKSANDAAVALAEAVAGSEKDFVRMMNMKAAAIGANDTVFINPNGLPGKGQHTTAYDLAKIMRYAIRYPILKEILGTRMAEINTENGRSLFIKNTNKLLWSDEDILGGKTGFTNQARHCFVSAGERNNNTLVVALLGAPSRDLLWKETEELLSVGEKVLKNYEEPVIYLTRTDYDAMDFTNASYTKKIVKRSSLKHRSGTKSKKINVITASKKRSEHNFEKKKSTKKVQVAKKKQSSGYASKMKKQKRTSVAKKGENAING